MKKIRIKRALRFLKAAGRHYWYSLFYFGWSGLQASRKDWQDRINTCSKCAYRDSVLDECEICECIIPLKAKWLDEDCPADKWDKSIIPRIFRRQEINEKRKKH